GGVELVDSGANRLAHPHCSHPSSVVGPVVGTSDFRGTHSAFPLLAKSLSLTLSHALSGGCTLFPAAVRRGGSQRWRTRRRVAGPSSAVVPDRARSARCAQGRRGSARAVRAWPAAGPGT